MTSNVFGLIYTGETNQRISDLTFSRSIAAVPFGGRYRCIDFVLSSMVNSGINNVGMITQKNYHSLIDHVGSGKEWDLHRKRDGLFILPPYVAKDNVALYKGTVDALSAVMGYVRRSAQSYCLLTGSHTIFNTTYDEMIEKHMQSGADITIMYNEDTNFDPETQYDDLRIDMDASGRITDMEYNPYRPKTDYRSCDVFLMKKDVLEYLIEDARSHILHDFIGDILIKKVNSLKIYGYRYDGYVARLDSLTSYFAHSMALLSPEVRKDLFSVEHPIYTKVKDEVPARYGMSATVSNSMIADGCTIEGHVENSIIFRGVSIARDAVVKNCIIMQGSTVSENALLDYVVMDKDVTVKKGRKLAGYNSIPLVLRKNSVV